MGHTHSQLEPTVARSVWDNNDLVHEIMDFMEAFKEIVMITQIRRSTSNSLFSYRFKDRKDQICNGLLFIEMARTYYSSFIDKKCKTWYGMKSTISNLSRPNNCNRLLALRFHSFDINLDYVDNDYTNILSTCNRLIFRNFNPSQLTRICKMNKPFLVNILELKNCPADYNIWLNSFPCSSLGSTLPHVAKVILSGNGTTGSMSDLVLSTMLHALPSFHSLDSTQYLVPYSLLWLLPMLTELSLNINTFPDDGPAVNLGSLTALKKLFISGDYITHPRPQCILLPDGLEELDIPSLMWHPNQLIPKSVKILRFECYGNSPYKSMQCAVEESSIECLHLDGYYSFSWWKNFQIPSNIKCIKFTRSVNLNMIIKLLESSPNNRLTHLLYNSFYDNISRSWDPYRLIICGKNLKDIPSSFTRISSACPWHHIDLKRVPLYVPLCIISAINQSSPRYYDSLPRYYELD